MYKLIKANKFSVHSVIRNFSNSVKSLSNSSENTNNVLGNAYVPREIEDCHNKDYFYSDKKIKDQFTLLLPPPNITGTLHLGHALAVTIQDVLIRWSRMRGMETLWVPGMDHAGIATQVIVEKKLWKERNQTRQDLGRDLFVKEIWKWKEEKADIIGQQLRQMGASLDWSRQMFTMDAAQSRAVTEAFIKLYECGLIYRSDYLVNWSCVLGSAISDIEVEHLEVTGPTLVSVPGYEQPVQFGILTKFAYKLHDSDEEIVVATTRPETMLGDSAIAVHPNDERYTSLIGKMCWHPFRNEKIPIICDEMVDPGFGTGAVKITPAHDHVDFAAGKRHNLHLLQIIDEKGMINCGKFKDVRRFDARNIIVDELHRMNLLRGKQDHEMIVPICGRSNDVVEFLPKPQWFLKCDEMAAKALNDVNEGRLRIEPERFVKDWMNWLENIRDWCISRQLWWGHRIPIYFCGVEGEQDHTCCVAARDQEAAKSKAALALKCPSNIIVAVQDEDVLDTWFSSALLPFSAFGWPEQTNDLKHFYPLSLMETGHDILFFWVARMVMLGTHLTGQLPFPKVLLHGIVCDAQGRKMSKSLGNVIAPEDIILGSSHQVLNPSLRFAGPPQSVDTVNILSIRQNKHMVAVVYLLMQMLNIRHNILIPQKFNDLESRSRASHAQGVLTGDELEKALRNQKKMFPEGIPDCGADALRFTLCTHNIKNHYISFDVQECKTNKFFGNKLWQAAKFTNKWIDSVSEAQEMEKVKYECLERLDKWILSRLSLMVETVNRGLEKYELHSATNALKNFLYYEFCDIYLETTKRGLRHVDSSVACDHCWTLSTCLDVGLRCLSPFMPRLSKHLHQHLRTHPRTQRRFDFPQNLPWRDVEIEKDVDKMMEVVVAIRRLKKMFNLTAKHKPKVFLVTQLSRLRELRDAIEDLSGCDEITVANEIESAFLSMGTVSDSVGGGDVTLHLAVPADLRRTFEVDLQKLEKKRSKLIAELHKIKKIISSDGHKLKASERTQEGLSKKMATLEESIARIDYMHRLSESFSSKVN